MAGAMGNSEHKDLVREEFTRQANDYATAPAIRDAEHLSKLVEIVAPPRDARVLEVATGPGHVAMAFAEVCREVVGIDFTDAPLKIAEKIARSAESPTSASRRATSSRGCHSRMANSMSSCAVSRFIISRARKVIAEMARVCRADGLVAVEDLIASEQPERAAYYNEFERCATRRIPVRSR